ncbi:hypothetical protein ACJRO7_031765 [Eucalyptus globulus]|uniref:Retrotransposon gag domain-containing protein n=1 Tax=Eucalyptus globulus TaxID=34317 RepID=A0ABD3JJT5_EUCGL
MVDNTEQTHVAEEARVAALESDMKQVMNVLERLSKQIDSLQANTASPAPQVEVVLPQQAPMVDPKDKGKNTVDPRDKGKNTSISGPSTSDDSSKEKITNVPQIVVDDEVQVIPSAVPKTEQEKRLIKIEEKLKQLQGSFSQDPTDLSHYAKIKMPKKFKMPDFEKYDGTSCPKIHLQTYVVRMTQYVDNIPLMIQQFQASLTGPSLQWYIMKKINLLETWEDLTDAFFKQYKYNIDVTPSREDLLRTEKKRTESFKAYVTRWRTVAAQITPEPTEKELMDLFMKTLPPEYRNRMLGSTAESFNQLIPVGERIEVALRDGWASDQTSSYGRVSIKKDKELVAEVNAAYVQPPRPTPNTHQGGARPFFGQQKNSSKRQFTPLPKPLSKILPTLQKKGLLAKEPKRPNPERFPNYDPSKTCAYHMGEVGHSVDDCYTLQHKIQNLLDANVVSFRDARPNIQNNPLPNHPEAVNVIFRF